MDLEDTHTQHKMTDNLRKDFRIGYMRVLEIFFLITVHVQTSASLIMNSLTLVVLFS